VANFFNDFASKSTMSEMVRKVLTTEMQMMLKKSGSKIYPVRFSEIARIKVLKSPEFHAARPMPEEAAETAAEPPAEEAKEKPAPMKERKKPGRKEKSEKAEAKESKKKPEAE
jgi:hypothetical protein